MKEYLHMDDLVGELDEQYDDLSTEQVETAVDVMAQRYGDDLYVSPDDVELEEVHNGAVEIDIEEVEDSPIYADPNAAEGEDHLCVTWGNLGNDGSPPEGRAQDGSGDDLFGIR
ncbi:hypothetical protein [Candidatus Nanohalovita haloferacivicina]|uniref:hypothetical protein n=1 Tax=Candidatus Nanohalovita haloferacivicina TaxID=2978046 RepID=UPI00325FDF1B